MRFVIVLALLMLGSFAHARVDESVTCGQAVGLNGDQVKLVSKNKTYFVNKSGVQANAAGRIAIPSNVCVASKRLPAAVESANQLSSLYLRPPIFRNANQLNWMERSHLKMHPPKFKLLHAN